MKKTERERSIKSVKPLMWMDLSGAVWGCKATMGKMKKRSGETDLKW